MTTLNMPDINKFHIAELWLQPKNVAILSTQKTHLETLRRRSRQQQQQQPLATHQKRVSTKLVVSPGRLFFSHIFIWLAVCRFTQETLADEAADCHIRMGKVRNETAGVTLIHVNLGQEQKKKIPEWESHTLALIKSRRKVAERASSTNWNKNTVSLCIGRCTQRQQQGISAGQTSCLKTTICPWWNSNDKANTFGGTPAN